MDDLQLKNRKKTRKHSFIANFIGIAVLLSIAILVLLYGRIELVNSLDLQNETINNDNNRDSEALSDEQRDVLRQKYIEKMNIYENETKGEIKKLNLAAWSTESITVLHEEQQKALKAFGESRFGVALSHLDNLFKKALELQQLQKQNFQSALSEAQQAFTSGDYEQASSAIANALRYFPENQDAHLLKERIGAMEAIAELVKAADIAHTENDLDKEIRLLNDAIKLDPHRNDLKQRQQRLIEKQRQLKLDALLQQASQAIADQNVAKAQAILSQIKQIDLTHPSLDLLANKLKQTRAEITYRSLLAKAEAAERKDDWQTAENHYRQALQVFSDNKEIADRLQLASQINRYANIIVQALAKPERLADEQIAQAMKQLADDSAEYTKHSPRLGSLIEQLNDAITEMSIPVAVTVYSDKQTYVSVLGIGIIGKVSEYKLKEGLRPGRYLFKGERKGFKDKLVEIHIQPNRSAIVKVVCDEPV